MEKAKITDISFDMEDAKLLALQTDLLLKAKAIQYNILPKLNTLLEESISQVRKIYGIEVFNEDSIVHSSPSFREKRENELKLNYDFAIIGLTGAGRPIWKGVERKDGKPVKVISYVLRFVLLEDCLQVHFGHWIIPKLTNASLMKYLEFLGKNADLVQALQEFSGMVGNWPSYEEDNIMVPFTRRIDRLIEYNEFQLDFLKRIRFPLGFDELKEAVRSFVIFYPIYDSLLRIAKGEKARLEELTSKFKLKDYEMFPDNPEDGGFCGSEGEKPDSLMSEDEKDLLERSVDGKKVVKAGIRWQVMERDDFKCVACGLSAKNGAILHVDHVKPRSKGGTDTMDNYQTLCHQCNIGKSNKSQRGLR